VLQQRVLEELWCYRGNRLLEELRCCNRGCWRNCGVTEVMVTNGLLEELRCCNRGCWINCGVTEVTGYWRK
jgi:hypothetical protein